MQLLVSIIMGNTSDSPIMQYAAKQLEALEIPFELLALSTHRTSDEVAQFARSVEERGVHVIMTAAGMAAHPCGVIAPMTTLPVIEVPIDAPLERLDVLLAIVQVPPGTPVATAGANAAQNAAPLAAQMLALDDPEIAQGMRAQKAPLREKIVKANKELAQISDCKCKAN